MKPNFNDEGSDSVHFLHFFHRKFFIFYFFLCNILFAQENFKINFFLKDKATGEPVEGANISRNNSFLGYSSSSGSFEFISGDSITISHIAFKTKKIGIISHLRAHRINKWIKDYKIYI